MLDDHDTVPSPPPIETIPPDTIPYNPIPEIKVEDLEDIITTPNFNVPFIMVLISAGATLFSMLYRFF